MMAENLDQEMNGWSVSAGHASDGWVDGTLARWLEPLDFDCRGRKE
jgi:hypothetical protein